MPRMSPILTIAAAALLIALGGCATQASLTVLSQPEGAYLTEKGSGKALGIAPAIAHYDGQALLSFKGRDGCYLVRGFEARWISGATASLENVRLCGSNTGNYNITFNRDPSGPGFEKDLQFSLQLRALRAQQQQAQAAETAATAALLRAFSAPQTSTISCTSMQTGNMVQTNCR